MDGPVPYEKQSTGFKLEWLMAMKAPRLRSVLQWRQASLGTDICRPKSASCSDIESYFSSQRQTYSSRITRLKNVMVILVEDQNFT